MSVTQDDQFSWRSFTIGAGTSYPIFHVEGLGKVDVRRSTFDRVGANGVIIARTDLLGPRIVTIEIAVQGTSRSDLQSKLDALAAATTSSSSGDEAVQFQILGTLKRFYGRPSPADWPWDVTGDAGLFVQKVGLEFFCQDPRIYTDSTSSVTLA